MSEEIEIRKFRQGDHDAFKNLFNRYSQPLLHFSLSYLKSKESAEDVVQEVFTKIWDKRKDIKSNTSFKSYLFTIALNSIRKYFNKLAIVNEAKHHLLSNSSDIIQNLDDDSGYQLLLDKLNDLIQQMPEKQRRVFVKKKLEEKSIKEIADELSISSKTVEYHISTAMKFLKEEFVKLGSGGLLFLSLFF